MTALNYNLAVLGLAPNVSVARVTDIGAGLRYEYV